MNKHQELRAALTMELKKMGAGDALPSERALMARHGVSRMTVRQAIAALADDGLVHRVQGSGTFVADPAFVSKSLHLTSFSEDIRSRQMVPGTRLLSSELVGADAGVAHDLALEPGTPVVHLERLRTADKSPMCLENVWLPAALVEDVDYADTHVSLYDSMERAGMSPQFADQRVRATVLNAREAELLDVPAFSAALIVARVTYDVRHRRVEKAVSLYRADRYDFELTIARSHARSHR